MTEAQLKRAAEIQINIDYIDDAISRQHIIGTPQLTITAFGADQVRRLKQWLKSELARLKEEAEEL